MVELRRGEIWWANLREPLGSEPGYRRPIVIISSDEANASPIQTVLAVSLTGNLSLQYAPGNVFLPAQATGLPKDCVANVSQIFTADKSFLVEFAGEVDAPLMRAISMGLRLVMDL